MTRVGASLRPSKNAPLSRTPPIWQRRWATNSLHSCAGASSNGAGVVAALKKIMNNLQVVRDALGGLPEQLWVLRPSVVVSRDAVSVARDVKCVAVLPGGLECQADTLAAGGPPVERQPRIRRQVPERARRRLIRKATAVQSQCERTSVAGGDIQVEVGPLELLELPAAPVLTGKKAC